MTELLIIASAFAIVGCVLALAILLGRRIFDAYLED